VSVIEDERVFRQRFIDQEEPEITGDLVDTIAVTGRFDLTDAQWAVLEPLLPTGKRPGRPSLWTKRDQRMAVIDFDTDPKALGST
jgi:hypothetical protein